MIIDMISDLHGYKPKMKGGDLLIIAGDMTGQDTDNDWDQFTKWLHTLSYQKIVMIGGNHDNYLVKNGFTWVDRLVYLKDTSYEFNGIKIYGSPWTRKFRYQNPHAMAFSLGSAEEMREKWSTIPADIDILITHSPPYAILDYSCRGNRCGCDELLEKVYTIRPRIHVFGHIHEMGGTIQHKDGIMFVNASHVDEEYRQTNDAIRVVY